MKNKTTALILSILLGGLGVDRFYLGYTGMGLLKLFTGGCFGVLYIIDIIYIATGKLQPADGSRYEGDDPIFGNSANNQPGNGSQSNSYPNNPAPVQAPIDHSAIYEELSKLGKLHADGIISDEEFARLKAVCLSKM